MRTVAYSDLVVMVEVHDGKHGIVVNLVPLIYIIISAAQEKVRLESQARLSV